MQMLSLVINNSTMYNTHNTLKEYTMKMAEAINKLNEARCNVITIMVNDMISKGIESEGSISFDDLYLEISNNTELEPTTFKMLEDAVNHNISLFDINNDTVDYKVGV